MAAVGRFRFTWDDVPLPCGGIARLDRWLTAPDFGLRVVHPSGINPSTGKPDS
jgi:hypothetical protein